MNVNIELNQTKHVGRKIMKAYVPDKHGREKVLAILRRNPGLTPKEVLEYLPGTAYTAICKRMTVMFHAGQLTRSGHHYYIAEPNIRPVHMVHVEDVRPRETEIQVIQSPITVTGDTVCIDSLNLIQARALYIKLHDYFTVPHAVAA